MSSTDHHSSGQKILKNSLNNNEATAITLLMPSQDSSTTFKKAPIHVTENQVHDAAHHFKLEEDSLFLNKDDNQQSYQTKRSNILKIDNTGWHRFLPKCLRFAFADHEFEQLYSEYYENEKRSDFKTLILIIFIVNLSFLSVRLFSLERQNKQLMVTLCAIAISLVLIYISVSRRIIENQRKLSLRLKKADEKDNLLNQRTKLQQLLYDCFNLFTLDNLIWFMMPYLIWFLILFEIFIDLIYFKSNKFSLCDALSSLLLFTYAIYVVFPLRLRIASTLAVLTAIFYLSLQLSNQTLIEDNGLKFRLLFADLFLIICVNLIGLMSYFFYEKRQRRAFLETCICLENKLDEQEESQEQERLLLSVLPEHVVVNIREDLGSVINKPFKRIYMKRHENVSILFADIVGFTAISSTLPAPQLVKILNELFARFDKLSEKYSQLRIKILGDCYYCISGAPVKRIDHAVLCVHMGLSMVEVIKSVREQTKFNVDMRVGIHTGGVIAGVLGQKQWQFDVYSKDVELANKMESGGLPGRVHISEDTVEFLNGEFELEDGLGYTREETIKSLGIKTFLIVKVLKPYPEGTLDDKSVNENLDSSQTIEQQKLLQEVANQTATNDTNNNNSTAQKNNDVQRKVSNAITRASITGHTSTVVADSTADYSTATSHSSINQLGQGMDEYQRRLRYELLNRDNVQMGQRIRPFTFSFSDSDYEHQYMNDSDETAGVSLTGLPITALLTTFAEFTLGVTSLFSCSVLICSSLAQSFLALLSTVTSWAGRRYSYTNENSFEKDDNSNLETFDQKQPLNEQISMKELKTGVNEKSPLKNGDHTLNNLKLSVNSSPHKTRNLSRYSSASHKSIFNKYRLNDEKILVPNCLPRPLLSISLAVQHNATVRLIIYILMISIWLSTSVVINLDYYNHTKTINLKAANKTAKGSICNDRASVDSEISDKSIKSIKSLYLTYYIVLLLLSISALKRISLLLKMAIIFGCTIFQTVMNFIFHKGIMAALDNNCYRIDLEVDGHLIYLTIQLLGITISCFILNRQFELMSRRLFLWQKEVEEQKKKVKMMKNKNEKLLYNILPLHVAIHFLGRRKRDEELYSKSYNSVGVLFAAMPNFTDFYTEESVNNQGLECLRFLNEVISDFDGLLDQERFRNISKIKTISSTYMAASGLNTEIDTEDEETELTTRWAHLADLTHFALALKETLDNINKESFNNFVLKIGINHGPITAGVIGARKPHYDIWGNTVNVASRMESTGKAGSIQVTEETSKILQLFGFKFEPRGQVAVKGKGKLMTYYLVNSK